MKKIIAGTIIALMLPVSVGAYGGGFGIGNGFGPRNVTPYEYRANVQKKILQLKIQVLKLQIQILKMHRGK